LTEHLSLEEAVARHIRAGDKLHLMLGHSRWTASARELVRQHWGSDLGLTLMMVSLSSLGALFFRGGLLKKVVTAYSGDSFPTYSPNPVFQQAYASGGVEVEHWSILTFAQRLEAAARGLPAVVTSSLTGSSMAANDGYVEVDSELGRVGLLAPMVPDVTLLHAAVADRAGNVALHPPLLEGPWGALAARRGAIVTVEAVVDDLTPWSHLVRIPAHRVVAVVEAPFGAHPGGVFAGSLPVEGYGEDIAFWTDARAAARGDFDAWARQWCLDVPTQDAYLARLGTDRQAWLKARTDRESWRDDQEAHPVDEQAPVTAWETAAAFGVRELGDRIAALDASAVLAGAGAANLAAWVAVTDARARGADVVLTAELGLWGYTPTLADPYIFNQRSFPSATMLADASHVLGLLVDDERTRTIGCLGAAQVDRHGNVNSTRLADGTFLVGSGGANDVASRAAECLVITLAGPLRLADELGFVTSPGARVQAVVTDRGILRKRDGELCLAAVPAGESPLADRVRAAVDACGWDLRVDRDVDELGPPSHAEVLALRRYDPERWFLR
jgi:acyl CoA:acetate/3-ketoacid CoA transferase alpha subunit/acyl CoA:acetate/3-ketoacid CoA transferase beta subunit